MAEITWKNVNSLTDVNPYLSAIRNMQGSLSALANIGSNYIERRHQDDIRANEKLTQMNTDMVVNQMNQVQDFAQLQKAKQSGAYDLSDLQALTGGAIDGKQFNQAYSNWDKNVLDKVQTADTAKDYNPETIALTNQYNQALASGDTATAQALYNKINGSRPTMYTLGKDLYGVAKNERDYAYRDRAEQRQDDELILQYTEAEKAAKAKKAATEAQLKPTLDAILSTHPDLLKLSPDSPEYQSIVEAEKAKLYGSNADWVSANESLASTQTKLAALQDRQATYAANKASGNTDNNPYSPQTGTPSRTTVKPNFSSLIDRYNNDTQFKEYFNDGLKHLKDKGFSHPHSLGILASINAESGYNPTYMFGSHTDTTNGLTNQGIISFQGSRKNALMNYLGEKGHLNSDGTIKQTKAAYLAQLDFITDVEGKGSEKVGFNKYLANTSSDVNSLAQAFDDHFVRSKGANFKGQDAKIKAQRHEAYTAIANLDQYISNNAKSAEQVQTARAVVEDTIKSSDSNNPETTVEKAKEAAKDVLQQDTTATYDAIKTVGDNTFFDTNVASAFNKKASAAYNAKKEADLEQHNKPVHTTSANADTATNNLITTLVDIGLNKITENALKAGELQAINNILGISPSDPNSGKVFNQIPDALKNYDDGVRSVANQRKQEIFTRNGLTEEQASLLNTDWFDDKSVSITDKTGNTAVYNKDSAYNLFFNKDGQIKTDSEIKAAIRGVMGEDGFWDRWTTFDNFKATLKATKNPLAMMKAYQHYRALTYRTKYPNAKEIPSDYTPDFDYNDFNDKDYGNQLHKAFDAMRAIDSSKASTLSIELRRLNQDMQSALSPQNKLNYLRSAVTGRDRDNLLKQDVSGYLESTKQMPNRSYSKNIIDFEKQAAKEGRDILDKYFPKASYDKFNGSGILGIDVRKQDSFIKRNLSDKDMEIVQKFLIKYQGTPAADMVLQRIKELSSNGRIQLFK